MSTTQPAMKKWPSDTRPTVTRVFKARRANIGSTVHFASNHTGHLKVFADSEQAVSPLGKRERWQDREYREAYMEAAIEQGVAWQIQINRKFRSMSQKDLAVAIGTQQSSISRFEDPEYGAHSLDSLKEIAKAFDCALQVKFISYSDLAREGENLSETDQYAVPYSLDVERQNG